jgi:hypothetical protein
LLAAALAEQKQREGPSIVTPSSRHLMRTHGSRSGLLICQDASIRPFTRERTMLHGICSKLLEAATCGWPPSFAISAAGLASIADPAAGAQRASVFRRTGSFNPRRDPRDPDQIDRSRRRWLDELTNGAIANAEEIAVREKCSLRQVHMTISLAFLAPNLVKAAIEGRLPRGIGVTRLRDAPAEWSRQSTMLGLTS